MKQLQCQYDLLPCSELNTSNMTCKSCSECDRFDVVRPSKGLWMPETKTRLKIYVIFCIGLGILILIHLINS